MNKTPGEIYNDIVSQLEGSSIFGKLATRFQNISQRYPSNGTSWPEKGNITTNPFFIIGPGRSGNTLLRRILIAHPDIHIPPESYVLAEAIRFFRLNNNRPWKKIVQGVLSIFEYHPLFHLWDIHLRDLACQLYSIPQDNRSLAFILDSLYRFHGNNTHSNSFKRWGDKTPMNAQWVDLIAAVFPNAQFIFMIRDGIDVVSSYIDANLQSLESAAMVWRTRSRRAESFLKRHPRKCLKIKYEDLVSKPEENIRQVCSFLDLSFSPSMLTDTTLAAKLNEFKVHKHYQNVLQPISSSSIGKGHRKLSSMQKNKIRSIIGQELKQHDYVY